MGEGVGGSVWLQHMYMHTHTCTHIHTCTRAHTHVHARAHAQVAAVAHDNPIPGFGTRNCINLRLWAAKPAREFDLEAFNTGECCGCVMLNTG